MNMTLLTGGALAAVMKELYLKSASVICIVQRALRDKGGEYGATQLPVKCHL